jgi:hypothetical protein
MLLIRLKRGWFRYWLPNARTHKGDERPPQKHWIIAAVLLYAAMKRVAWIVSPTIDYL